MYPRGPHDDLQDSGPVKYFKIYRWDPESKQKPYFSSYPINLKECVFSVPYPSSVLTLHLCVCLCVCAL